MQDFRKLAVWQKAHELTLSVYRNTSRVRCGAYPGMVSQIRRAAASVPTNIAEGCGHWGPRELARFLQISLASVCELEYHLILASDLSVLSRPSCEQLAESVSEVKRMLISLIIRVRKAAGVEAKKVARDPDEAITGD